MGTSYDLIVIGGGYWGTAIAYEASKLWDTLLIDDGDPMAGSRAASGIVDPKVYFGDPRKRVLLPDSWSKQDIDASLGWAKENLGAVYQPGTFLNLMAGDTEPRPEKSQNLYLIRPSNYLLLYPRTHGRVMGFATKGSLSGIMRWVMMGDGQEYQTKRLCIAAGYRTDEVLQMLGIPPLGVGRLYGRGMVFSGKPIHPIPLTIMTRPYTKYTIRPWEAEGQYRLGDTAEKHIDDTGRMTELLVLGAKMSDPFQFHEQVQGYRPILSKFTVEAVAPGVVAATGGHRVGLGLSGHVAKVALGLLKGV